MSNGRPYGNDFIVGTPHLDQLHNQLYLEQRNKELQKQRDVAALDDEYTKNVANIKDADVEDVTAAYSDYKQSYKDLMKKKGGGTPQEQLEVLRKKAAMYKLINESKAEKENIALLGKAIRSDAKGIYDANAPARLQARLKTPTSKYGSYAEVGPDGKPMPIDLRDDNAYLYKLGASDFSKDLEEARGKERFLADGDRVEDPNDKLSWKVPKYRGKNNAIEFYEKLLPRIAGSKEQRDFVLRTDMEYPPEKAAALETRYKQIVNDPLYRKRYGLKDGDEIPLSSYDSPLARAVRIKAMEHVVNNPVIESAEKISKNTSAVMDRQEAFRRAFQAQGFENNKALAGLHNYYSNMSYDRRQEALSGDIDEFIDRQIKNAKPARTGWLSDGSQDLEAGPTMLAAFKDPNTTYAPSGISVMPNGKFKLKATYATDKSGKQQEVFPERYISRDEYKAGLANTPFNTAVKIRQIGTTKSTTTTTTKATSTKSSIPAHSKADWLKAGWSEDQISKAVKAGKIKVN